MPEAVLSPQEWEAVKLTSIKGVPDSEIAAQFGITNEAIRQRRFRDPVWKAANELKVGRCNEVSQREEKEQETASLAQKVASAVSENVASIAAANNLLALQIAQKGLQKANLAPPEVKAWSDVEILAKITAKAAGLDNANAVQVNVLSSGPVDFVPGFGVEH